MTIPAILWLALFPLLTGGSYAHITADKHTAMLILLAASAAVTACGALRLMRGRNAEAARLPAGGRFRPSAGAMLPYAAAILLFGWMTLSALLGAWHTAVNANGQSAVWYGMKRYEGMLTQYGYFAVFLLLSLRRVKARAVISAASLAVIAFAVITALQYFGINVFGLYPAGRSILTNYEFQGTIGNIDMVSGYLSLALPFVAFAFALRAEPLPAASSFCAMLLLLCIEVQSGLIAMAFLFLLLLILSAVRPAVRARVCLLCAMLCAAVCLRLLIRLPWLDGSETLCLAPWSGRMTLCAIACLAFLALAVILRRHPGRPVRLRTALLFAAALIALAVLAVYLVPGESLSGGVWELHEVLHGRAQDGFGSERLHVWRCAAAMIAEHPVSGCGQDTFWLALPDYLTRTGDAIAQQFDNPHNEYLALAVNGGVPALLLYLLLLAAVCVPALRRGREEPFALCCLAAVLCYAVQGVFSFSICLVAPMFWAVLGMAAAAARRECSSVIK